MAVRGLDRAVDYRQIAFEDAGALHALAGDRHQVHMRSPYVQDLIQRYVGLDVVRCR
ncbi:hypothetical protein D3C77_629290 [compost metagenome]